MTFKRYKGLASLIVMFAAMPLLAYKLAIADTVKMARETKQLKNDIEILRAQSSLEDEHRNEPVEYGDMIRNGELLAKILEIKTDKGFSVEKYSPYVSQIKENHSLQTAEVVLKGYFGDLLDVTHHIESSIPACKLSSVNFKTVRSRQNNTAELYLTLIIQQITKTK